MTNYPPVKTPRRMPGSMSSRRLNWPTVTGTGAESRGLALSRAGLARREARRGVEGNNHMENRVCYFFCFFRKPSDAADQPSLFVCGRDPACRAVAPVSLEEPSRQHQSAESQHEQGGEATQRERERKADDI
jgi:hypothetical protein